MSVNEKAWIDVGGIGDIPRRGARVVRTPFGPVAVFHTADGGLFAIEDRCPHRGGPLSQGIVHGNAVTCPLHNWVISLETGEAQGEDEGCVKRLPLRLNGERILIDIAPVAARAAAA
jgi:nitrite reductase (NADH) small subunit